MELLNVSINLIMIRKFKLITITIIKIRYNFILKAKLS